MAGDELLAAGARTGWVVGDVFTGAGLAPGLVEQCDRVLLSGRPLGGQVLFAAAVDVLARLAGGARLSAGRVFVAAAAGQRECGNRCRRYRDAQCLANRVELHLVVLS